MHFANEANIFCSDTIYIVFCQFRNQIPMFAETQTPSVCNKKRAFIAFSFSLSLKNWFTFRVQYIPWDLFLSSVSTPENIFIVLYYAIVLMLILESISSPGLWLTFKTDALSSTNLFHNYFLSQNLSFDITFWRPKSCLLVKCSRYSIRHFSVSVYK